MQTQRELSSGSQIPEDFPLILHLPQDIKKKEKLGYRSERNNHPAGIASSFCLIQSLIHQLIHWRFCEIYGFLHKVG